MRLPDDVYYINRRVHWLRYLYLLIGELFMPFGLLASQRLLN